MSRRADPSLALARRRLRLISALFGVALAAVSLRMVDLALSVETVISGPAMAGAMVARGRADIIDRNGVLLATDYPKASVFADPQEVLDPAATAARLADVLGMEPGVLQSRLARSGRFVWLKRHITDAEQRAIMQLGLPGIGFRTELHRVYPQRALSAHSVGFVGVENQGLSGIERAFEERLTAPERRDEPLMITLDLSVQEVVRSELAAAVSRFGAEGGSGIVLDVASGEILAMVSLPDFDPNHYQRARKISRFNRNTQGTYELGSLLKLFTVAMALDAGAVEISGGLDASEPFVIRPHRIRDFHAKKRWLSIPEVIAFSSNIGAAKMAHALGVEQQRAYFERFGLLSRHPIRLPEVGVPQIPQPWRPINTITASYGHGLAVSPLQTADALAGLLCAARGARAHLVAEGPLPAREPLVSVETSSMLRWLMWLVVAEGTGTLAEVSGYLVGGKTGSADKAGPRGYGGGGILASFVGAFPMDQPRFVVLVTLDEPKGDEGTHFQGQGGWTAAPTVGRIISRIGPLLGMPPVAAEREAWFRDRLIEGEAWNGRLQRPEASFRVAPNASWSLGPAGEAEGQASCGCRPCSVLG